MRRIIRWIDTEKEKTARPPQMSSESYYYIRTKRLIGDWVAFFEIILDFEGLGVSLSRWE